MLSALPGCGHSDDSTGTGGTGGNSPPPASVDQTCRDWCANEPGAFSCYQGPPESVQSCYQGCLDDYQEQEAQYECGDEWIAIKDCQLELDCEDLFGDCDALEEMLGECQQLASNRDYCETNCPDIDIAQCEQDTSLCLRVGNDSSLVGGTCMNRTECDELLCQTGPQFPGNVCTISCGNSGMCPQGSSCAALDQEWICLLDCTASGDCRTDWECLPVVEAPPPLSGESPKLVEVCIGP